MSNYDKSLKQRPKGSRPSKKASSDRTWNLLTIVMVVLTLCSCGYFATILQNPNSGLNFFPPNTLVPEPPTATITPLGFGPTWTPTITVAPTETSTRRPTITSAPTNTSYKIFTPTLTFTTTITVIASRTPRPTGVPYNATVSWEDSTKFRPDTSCSSMYVAGKALDSGNNPKTGLQVKLGGSIPGKVFLPEQNTTLTGISPIYGPSGFEFDLKIAPVASTKGLWVQLFDQSGAPLSDQVPLKTFSDCNKNLILVNFKQK